MKVLKVLADAPIGPLNIPFWPIVQLQIYFILMTNQSNQKSNLFLYVLGQCHKEHKMVIWMFHYPIQWNQCGIAEEQQSSIVGVRRWRLPQSKNLKLLRQKQTFHKWVVRYNSEKSPSHSMILRPMYSGNMTDSNHQWFPVQLGIVLQLALYSNL